jgi:Ribonuclease G/E
MTRKRIGEGLLESFSARCPECEGRGIVIDRDMLGGSE